MNRRDFFRRSLGLAVGLIGARGVPIINKPRVKTVQEIVRFLDVTTIQWIGTGGIKMNFKVMTVLCGPGKVYGYTNFPSRRSHE